MIEMTRCLSIDASLASLHGDDDEMELDETLVDGGDGGDGGNIGKSSQDGVGTVEHCVLYTVVDDDVKGVPQRDTDVTSYDGNENIDALGPS